MEHKLKLKFDDSFNGILFATQGDTARVFIVELCDEDDKIIDPSKYKLAFFVAQKDEVTKVDASIESNKFVIRCVNTQFKYAGKAKAQFVLYNQEDKKLASQIFDLNIEESIENGATVGVNVLVDFEDIKKAKELLEKQKDMLDEGKIVNKELETNIGEGRKVSTELVSNTSAAHGLSENLKTSTASASEAYTKLEASRDSADTLNNDLKANTAQGNKTNANLQSSISTAKNTQSTLQEKTAQGIDTSTKLGKSIKTGQDVVSKINEADKNLATSLTNASTVKTNLDTSIENAKAAKTNLDGSIDKANTAKTKLDTSTQAGSNTDNRLKETDTKANTSINTLQNLLSQSGAAEQNLKDIIASADLNKYITEPKLQEELAKIKTLKKEVVDTLPQTGKDDVIYLVKDSKGKTNNYYLEYLWINGAFELIGSTEVDLSGYAKTSDVDEKISKIDLSPYAKTSDVNNKLNSKVEKIEGKGLSTFDFTEGYRDKIVEFDNYIDHLESEMEGFERSVNKHISDKLSLKADKTEIKTKLSEMIDDASHRTVTDTEKNTWNSKANKSDIKTSLSELSSDSTHRTVTDEEKKCWSENSSTVEELSIIGLNLDNGIYKAVEYRKLDGGLAYKSKLIGEAPKYSKIKLSEYQGQQIKSTKTWNLFYDSNDFIYKKELERS